MQQSSFRPFGNHHRFSIFVQVCISLVSCRPWSDLAPLSLLGISAFAGFIVLLVGSPLNSYIMGRSIRIQKGVSASRDKRMAVLNELIGAVKFIKFFAWEERWIDRTMDARGVEMGWMVKGRSHFLPGAVTDG